MQFIIRLFPEITIKSPPVRKRWSKKLVDNLRILSRRICEDTAVILDWDRIIVRVKSNDPVIERSMMAMLASTPGIAHFSKVSAHPFSDLHDIYEHAQAQWQEQLSGKTFCVRVKRTGQHEFSSIDAERYIGGGLNQHCDTAGVKLKDPDLTIHIEIKGEQFYVVEERVAGLGGFPLGTQEDVLTLVSGGFDSTIASYMLMRRGMKTHFCFFNLGGKEHEVGVKEVAFYLWNKYGSSHRVRFISVPFEGVVSEILQSISPANMGVVLKRMMFRAAEQVANRAGVDAFVTGEAISQVSSQTLPNLSAIDRVTDKLVLRPLITMDKPEIINLSRHIGTEAFSANIPEYCGVISVKPSSKVNIKKLEAEEAEFNFSVLEQAIADTRSQLIDDVVSDIEAGTEPVDVLSVLEPGVTVVDIRHPNEIELRPISDEIVDKLEIPFYALDSQLSQLDAERRYALYCGKGVMSQLHAAHLKDKGFRSVCVFRPELAQKNEEKK